MNTKNTQVDYENELIKHLRKEAYDVKHCFTLFSFQGLAIVTAILGVAVRFDSSSLYPSGLIGLPLGLLLVTIARIGTHKYTTANRLAGYELHLQRTKRYPSYGAPGWNDRMRDIGWEEALRAWRIVQPTIFEYLYMHGDLSTATPKPSLFMRVKKLVLRRIRFWKSDRLRAKVKNSKGVVQQVPDETWFQTRTHLGPGTAYYPGGYLKTMLSVLYIFIFICIALSLKATFDYTFKVDHTLPELTLVSSFLFVFLYYIIGSIYETYARRKLLEEGLLSINSCAVLWQITICCHFNSLHILSKKSNSRFLSYSKYSKTLGAQAVDFSDNAFDIYNWYEQNSFAEISLIDPYYCGA